MSIDRTIEQLLNAQTIGNLQRCFRQLCSHVGEIQLAEIVLAGTYGDFCAFCTIQMNAREAQDELIRRFGFKQIGSKAYLAIALPTDFERRALARAA